VENALLNQLISSYGREYASNMGGEKPLLAEQPWRYMAPHNPASRTESFLSDVVSGGAAGTTSAWNGAISYDPEHMGRGATSWWGLGDLLETVGHENMHSKVTNISGASAKGLKNRAHEIMGGEEGYRKFLDSIGRKQKADSYWLYKLQSMVPGFGSDRMDEETIADWIGKTGVGHSKESLRKAIGETDPRIWGLFDLYTNGLDLLQERR
jgi:hypothetical protein